MSRLTPIGPASPPRVETWLYDCACGRRVALVRRSVTRGRVKSCGCLNQELRLARNTKHGKAKRGHANHLYWLWVAMRQRCTWPGHKDYSLYGARGISVCAAWDDFARFESDVGPRPPGMTLDRIDPNGNYEPGNVRWATWQQQRMNQRRMARETDNG